jgi:MazG family protein
LQVNLITKNKPMNTRQQQLESFGKLLDVLDELREKCPWDKKQTNQSLRTNTIEEVYELCDAILSDDNELIKKELGDVLLHIIFYAKIGSEKNAFDIMDVCDSLCEKLIYRHPHVFGEGEAETAKQVEQKWELLKLKEKGGNKTVLEGVPDGLPALIKAYRVQDKARNVGFDWEHREQVWDKVLEEFTELKSEIHAMDADKMEDEFGDLFFSIINAARLYKINPENALERTNRKFISRFNYLERQTIAQGKSLKDMSLEDMDAIWNEAKRQEKEIER